MQKLQVRPLSVKNAGDFRSLRLKSLQEDPRAFMARYEDEKDLPLQHFERNIEYSYQAPIFGFYGVFYSGELEAFAQIAKSSYYKKRHLVYLYNVYTKKEKRGQGIATKLINYLIEKIKSLEGYEYMHLWVNSGNERAISFYKKMGFKEVSSTPRSVKMQDGSYQSENCYALDLFD